MPGISQIDTGTWRDSWYWAFTPVSLRRVLAESFGTSVNVHSFGNVLTARLQTGYLYHYAFAMLIGAAAFITWFMFSGGAH